MEFDTESIIRLDSINVGCWRLAVSWILILHRLSHGSGCNMWARVYRLFTGWANTQAEWWVDGIVIRPWRLPVNWIFAAAFIRLQFATYWQSSTGYLPVALTLNVSWSQSWMALTSGPEGCQLIGYLLLHLLDYGLLHIGKVVQVRWLTGCTNTQVERWVDHRVGWHWRQALEVGSQLRHLLRHLLLHLLWHALLHVGKILQVLEHRRHCGINFCL